MEYQTSREFRGDPQAALDCAAQMLAVTGYELTAKNDGFVEALSSRAVWSSKEDPLRGASRLRVSHRVGELTLEAELDHVRRLGRFATLFPILLGAGLAIFFWVMFTFIDPQPGKINLVTFVCFASVSPWLFLGPWMSRLFVRRTEQALETFLGNVVMQAGER